jgi:DNA-directed RNA polymerase specialized sigma24 family protein
MLRPPPLCGPGSPGRLLRPLLAMDSAITRWSMISRLRAGSHADAWPWFIDRYRPAIRAMLRRRLPHGQVDDAEQEFWGYLYSSRVFERADKSRRFRSYLGGVVVNFARTWTRAGRRSAAVPLLDDAAVVGPEQAMESEEVRLWAGHLLRLALDDLRAERPEQCDCLCWFYGLADAAGNVAPQSVATIAARLGKNLAAVHQVLSRGRERLRARIEQEILESVADRDELVDEMAIIAAALGQTAPGLLR